MTCTRSCDSPPPRPPPDLGPTHQARPSHGPAPVVRSQHRVAHCANAPANCRVADQAGNLCTSDTCSATTGCLHANNSASCNDGVACTTNDVCSAGACGGVPSAALCNDANACTNDLCSAT